MPWGYLSDLTILTKNLKMPAGFVEINLKIISRILNISRTVCS
jgi:hypothetical protein